MSQIQSQKKTVWKPIESDESLDMPSTAIAPHETEQNAMTTRIKKPETVISELRSDMEKKHDIEKRKEEFNKIGGSMSLKNRIPIEQREKPEQTNTNQPDHSLIIEQIRTLVLDFDAMMKKFLTPDYPLRRSEKKKFADEVNRFRLVGFREMIRSLKIKVDSLCAFEDFDKKMFDLNGKAGWFDLNIKKAIDEKNFESAQYVVSAVMQLVMQDEVIMTKRKVLSQMR